MQSMGCGMSLENKALDEVFAVLASSPSAFDRLVRALDAQAGEERRVSDRWARAALMVPADVPQACVRLGRVQMLEELIELMQRHIKQ